MPTRVFFGADEASDVVVTSTGALTCTSPAHSGGAAEEVDITVETSAGTSPIAAADTYDYTTAAAVPTVTSITPDAGTTTGGDTVTIVGTDLDTAIAITFGTVPADMGTVVVILSTEITVAVPAGIGVGSVDVIVTGPAGDSPISDGATYAYTDLAPVLTILEIELADGTIISGGALTAAAIACSGTISVAWSGSDDIDTVLTNTYLARFHGPRIATGAPAFANYGCSFDTADLGDGLHTIEADAVDSSGNLGRSSDTQSPVVLSVNNGNSAAASGVRNPDFEHPNPVAAMAEVARTVIEHASPSVQAVVLQVSAALDTNAQAIEDYLNRNTVRRQITGGGIGTGDDHADTGWINVTPLVRQTVQKASPRSEFTVTIGVGGVGAGTGAWVDMGVLILGPGGYDHDFVVCRRSLVVGAMTHSASAAVASDAPRGTYSATLRVRCDAGAHWLSTVNDTLSLVVTETPLNG